MMDTYPLSRQVLYCAFTEQCNKGRTQQLLIADVHNNDVFVIVFHDYDVF